MIVFMPLMACFLVSRNVLLLQAAPWVLFDSDASSFVLFQPLAASVLSLFTENCVDVFVELDILTSLLKTDPSVFI